MKKRGILVLIVAAGTGSRMHSETPKQYLKVGSPEKTLVEFSLHALQKALPEAHFFIAVQKGDTYIKNLTLTNARILETGGATREETVYNTLLAIKDEFDPESFVFVHDAARALVDPADVRALYTKALEEIHSKRAVGVVLAMALPDTVKRMNLNETLTEDIDRAGLIRIATPQVFPLHVLLIALKESKEATDESSAVRSLGLPVKALIGSAKNFKITNPDDLVLAKRLTESPMKTRVGIGYDSHRFVGNRKLILGGVHIPYEKGLDGHSDADVLTHAIIDALLGAAHLGNIGLLFPDSDPAYKGANSIALLKEVVKRLKENSWRILNVDTVLITEAPKINPHLKAIEGSLAQALGLTAEDVSVKPKTNEKLGFEGREEGMSAQAIAMIAKVN